MNIDGGYVLDDALPVSPVCGFCKNKTGEYYRGCKAFPGDYSIPREIWVGKHNHRTPYPGDNGILFEPREDIPELKEPYVIYDPKKSKSKRKKK